jgi:hypothetical protein
VTRPPAWRSGTWAWERSAQAARLAAAFAVAVGPIHFCNLDCGDEVLAARLRARPAWRAWSEERIVEHQRFAAHLRASVRPTFDTGVLDADEVADRIARWIQRLLAAVDR